MTDETTTTKKAGLSPIEVGAGAGAAVIAAFASSYLGTAGTLTGAAVASVVGTVSTSVLRSSAQTSAHRFKETTTRLRETRVDQPQVTDVRPVESEDVDPYGTQLFGAPDLIDPEVRVGRGGATGADPGSTWETPTQRLRGPGPAGGGRYRSGGPGADAARPWTDSGTRTPWPDPAESPTVGTGAAPGPVTGPDRPATAGHSTAGAGDGAIGTNRGPGIDSWPSAGAGPSLPGAHGSTNWPGAGTTDLASGGPRESTRPSTSQNGPETTGARPYGAGTYGAGTYGAGTAGTGPGSSRADGAGDSGGRVKSGLRRVRGRWVVVGASAAAAFAVSLGAITGIEAAAGKPLSGLAGRDSGAGTTLGRATGSDRGSDRGTPNPTPTPSTSGGATSTAPAPGTGPTVSPTTPPSPTPSPSQQSPTRAPTQPSQAPSVSGQQAP